MLLAGAIGMFIVFVVNLTSATAEFGKIVTSLLGVVLLAFAGYVMQSRRVVVDPVKREIAIHSREWRRETVERLPFADIRKIQLLVSTERERTVARDRWVIALILDGRTVPLNKSPYPSMDLALRDAEEIQRRLPVEISKLSR